MLIIKPKQLSERKTCYVDEKFKINADLIDTDAREDIRGLKMMPAVIKCYHEMVHCRERDKAMNGGTNRSEYLRRSRVEMQCYVNQMQRNNSYENGVYSQDL